MAKVFPLDLGETASSRNNYQPSEGALHRAMGFYTRPSKGLALRSATEYICTDRSAGQYCGHLRSLIRKILITVYFKEGEYTFNIYDTTGYDVLIKTLTLAGTEPRLAAVGGKVSIDELPRNSAMTLPNNPFKGNSIIFIAGINTNLKYLDDDLVLKDFKINQDAGVTNTPTCHGVAAGQQRLVLLNAGGIRTKTDVFGAEIYVDQALNSVLSFSKLATLDNFRYSEIGDSSAFEVNIPDLGPAEVMYCISAIKKQVLCTTNEGLWVIRSIAEETKPLSFSNVLPYKVDNFPAIPDKAVQFDNNFVLYASTNGIIRVRQYNSLVDVSFPTTDPGGLIMPVVHEEFRGVKRIFYNGDPYLFFVIDETGNVYTIGPSFYIKVSTIIFPRTTFFASGDFIDGSGPNFTMVRTKHDGIAFYSMNNTRRMHQGLMFDYYPTLTITSQNNREITIDTDHVSQMLIKVSDQWVKFWYNGNVFMSNIDLPDIDGQALSYIPLLTDKNYIIMIPNWTQGVSAYQFTIDGTPYVVYNNIYDIRLDIDFSYSVSSYFIEEIGVGEIVIESDTLPGLDSNIREVGLMWNDEPDLTYDPLPRYDIGQNPDEVRTLYRHAFDPSFSSTKNTMTIKMTFDVEPMDNRYIALARIYTL